MTLPLQALQPNAAVVTRIHHGIHASHAFLQHVRAPLRKREFKTWLDKQSADTIIGIPRNPAACPLACYLFMTGRGMQFVGCSIRRLDGMGMPSIRLPAWARSFVRGVDCYSRPITVAQALQILDP
jgi:hypothetical protein